MPNGDIGFQEESDGSEGFASLGRLCVVLIGINLYDGTWRRPAAFSTGSTRPSSQPGPPPLASQAGLAARPAVGEQSGPRVGSGRPRPFGLSGQM